MKKIFFMCISVPMCISVLLSFGGCSTRNENWETIEIDECGTIKLPENWSCFYEDGLLYIFDGKEPVMIQYNRFDDIYSDKYHKKYVYIDTITSAVLSNGCMYGKVKLNYNDEEIERLYLHIGYEPEYCFIVWNEEINIEELVDIAKTFEEYV